MNFVEDNRQGRDVDYWLEMRNMAGEWEKTVLVFGYLGDYDECQKIADALAEVNYEREYRCTPALQSEGNA